MGSIFCPMDSNMLLFLEAVNSPVAASPEPEEFEPANPKPNSKSRDYWQCVAFSNEQYVRDMAKLIGLDSNLKLTMNDSGMTGMGRN